MQSGRRPAGACEAHVDRSALFVGMSYAQRAHGHVGATHYLSVEPALPLRHSLLTSYDASLLLTVVPRPSLLSDSL